MTHVATRVGQEVCVYGRLGGGSGYVCEREGGWCMGELDKTRLTHSHTGLIVRGWLSEL